jgi:hypothetical protein
VFFQKSKEGMTGAVVNERSVATSGGAFTCWVEVIAQGSAANGSDGAQHSLFKQQSARTVIKLNETALTALRVS